MKQRSKAELLDYARTYQAMQKDKRLGYGICGKEIFWRMAIEWASALWELEHFSGNEIAKALKYVNDNHVAELTDERRNEIRELMSDRCDYILGHKETINTKNQVQQEISELIFYNTEKSVDYSLLMCEYLILKKGFASKRLNRLINDIQYKDLYDAAMINELKNELLEEKGILIQLTDEAPENAVII